MREVFESAAARTVTLVCGGEERQLRAFLQLLAPDEAAQCAPTIAGVRDERRWRILMEPAEITAPAEIRDGAVCYRLLRWDAPGDGRHTEGILMRKAVAADAGSGD